MGSKDWFHRKAKTLADHKRAITSREPYARFLIVCEGSKTEPNYFKGLIRAWRINPANVVIKGKECGSTPDQVVKYALRLADEEEGNREPFDKVCRVFDQDKHEFFKTACDQLNQKNRRGNKTRFYPIISVPCFEYWLLLHFASVSHPYAPEGNLSVADVVIKELDVYWKNEFRDSYTKSGTDVFGKLLDRLEDACERSKRILTQQEAAGTDNPSTLVHMLVEDLQKLKKQ